MYKMVKIFYFSGTGNAENTAFWILDEALKLGIKGKCYDITQFLKNDKYPEIEKDTLIGFCSPTHGFDYPEIMRKFILHFPKQKNCKVMLLNTRAGTRIGRVVLPGLSGILHYKFAIILKIKGFDLVGMYPVDLPSNWLSIHPAIGKKGVSIIYDKIESEVRNFARKILTGMKCYKALYDIFQDLLVFPVSIIYSLFGRYLFAKTFFVSQSCNDCRLCIKNCPVNAIEIRRKRVFWTYKCESCMRCMNLCPEKAIQTGHIFIMLNAVLYVAVYHFFNKIFNLSELMTGLLKNNTLRFLLFSLGIIPVSMIMYGFYHNLLRFRFFNKVITKLSLTSYKFWGRYHSPKVEKKRENEYEF